MTPAWERTSTARAPYVCIFRHKEQRRPCTVWSTWNKKIGIKQKLNSNYVKMIKDVGGWRIGSSLGRSAVEETRKLAMPML